MHVFRETYPGTNGAGAARIFRGQVALEQMMILGVMLLALTLVFFRLFSFGRAIDKTSASRRRCEAALQPTSHALFKMLTSRICG